jgi:hypothetical protein
MSRFEYLSVLVSIVIALGIAEVTISWGRLLQRRREVTFSWLHAYWSLFTLFLMVQLWWGFWNFRTVEVWSFGALLAVVTESITLVLCALLLVPRVQDVDATLDLRRVYADNARPFFLLGASLIAQLTLVDWIILDTPLLDPENLSRLPGIAIALALAWTDDRRLHAALPGVATILLILFLWNAHTL